VSLLQRTDKFVLRNRIKVMRGVHRAVRSGFDQKFWNRTTRTYDHGLNRTGPKKSEVFYQRSEVGEIEREID